MKLNRRKQKQIMKLLMLGPTFTQVEALRIIGSGPFWELVAENNISIGRYDASLCKVTAAGLERLERGNEK